MELRFDVGTLSFAEPAYLWLLAVPAVLAVLWAAQLLRRRADARRYLRQRVIPVRQRYTAFGDLLFWLCLLVAASLCIVALARPQARVWVAGTAGADFVILQDGSSSMYVRDTAPDRWRRSMQFLQTFAETVNWQQDRIGLALFAYFAAPQLRLTNDPNALFFFLDRLSEQSPFRLEDDPTWNTNIEQAVDWGLRLIETHEELFGKTTNPKAFLVISDGQAWSGRVANALAAARNAGVAVHVVGVGTTAGGLIPETAGRTGRIQSVLDRSSLRDIARAGGGEYFELGSEPDRDIAARIISSVRRRAPAVPREERSEELYWRFLLAAAVVLCPGTLAIGQRAEWVWQAVGALAPAIDQFLKVTRSYWPGLFHCYAVPDLPRTNNALEQYCGAHRYHERRATGRKTATAALVLRGSVRLVAGAATRLRAFSPAAITPANLDAWKALRHDLTTRCQSRTLQRRFRRNATAYLVQLETELLQLTLPP